MLFVVGTGTLLGTMTASSVNLALPQMGVELGARVDRTGWVVTSFLLTMAALLLVAGRLADMIGHRRVYLMGFSLFGVASLACGLSSGLWWLIGARIVQGIGSAMLTSTGPALLTTSYPPERRGSALGKLMTATYMGLTIGPPLGGLLIAGLGWRWVFFSMVPVAVLVVALGLVYLPKDPSARRLVSFDVPGTLTLVTGLPILLLAMTEGGSWGWSSWRTLGFAATGVALIFAFLVTQGLARAPLMDLGLLRSRSMAAPALAATGQYVAVFSFVILLPYYLVEAIHMPMSRAGLVLSAQPLVMALISSTAGSIADRVGTRWMSVIGLVVLAGGLWGLSTLEVGSTAVTVAAWLSLVGLGTGIFISPNSSAIMGSAPRSKQGVAGGMIAVARTVGMAAGIAMSTSIFATAGGDTGGLWDATDVDAMNLALKVAAGVSVASAMAAAAGTEPVVKRGRG